MLLASDEVGNEPGIIGQHFMEPLYCIARGLHEEPLGSHLELPADGICWDFNAPDAIPDIVGGFRFDLAAQEADLVGPSAYAARVGGGWGHTHKRAIRELFSHELSVGSIGESLRNSGSFIDLDPTARDKNGVPLVRIHCFPDETE